MSNNKIDINDRKDSKTKAIKAQKILVVEGQDDWCFFKHFLEKKLKIKDVQLIDIGGDGNFLTVLKVLKLSPNFDKVEKIGLIRDTDKDLQKSFKRIKEAIEKGLQYKAPTNMNSWQKDEEHGIKLGVFLLPNNEEKGMLETLCMQSVADDAIMPCLNAYFECMDKVIPENKLPKNIAKARVQAFLASRKTYKSSVGFAAEKGYWNFDAECMQEIKSFLLTFK